MCSLVLSDQAPNVGQLANQLKEMGNEKREEEEEEVDKCEAPFLPYMYAAPQIKLREKSTVRVYSARVESSPVR